MPISLLAYYTVGGEFKLLLFVNTQHVGILYVFVSNSNVV